MPCVPMPVWIKPFCVKLSGSSRINPSRIMSAIKNNLSDSERHLVLFVFFKNNTLTNYAYYENISYVTASKRKKKALEKLNTLLKHA